MSIFYYKINKINIQVLKKYIFIKAIMIIAQYLIFLRLHSSSTFSSFQISAKDLFSLKLNHISFDNYLWWLFSYILLQYYSFLYVHYALDCIKALHTFKKKFFQLSFCSVLFFTSCNHFCMWYLSYPFGEILINHSVAAYLNKNPENVSFNE